jgi:hypothetical protein
MTPCKKLIKSNFKGGRYLSICNFLVWRFMKAKTGVVISLFFALVILTSSLPVASADQIYQPKGYWAYNGSTKGYIMSWNTTGSRVNRPSYRTGDSIKAKLRADGYWIADSGWWYKVPYADVNVTIYYPNNTPFMSFLNLQTDEYGIWNNDSLFTISKTLPMGRYKINASVAGPASGGPGGGNVDLSGSRLGDSGKEEYLTIFFDVGGDLTVNLSNIGFRVNKDTSISINGTILQPNGQVFNSSFVEGLGTFSYDVNITIMSPNGSVVRVTETTSTGGFSQSFTPDEVGTYYVTAFVQYRLGNQVIRNKFSMGRTAEKFISEGQWPETGLGFEQSLLSVAALLALAYMERKRGGRCR